MISPQHIKRWLARKKHFDLVGRYAQNQQESLQEQAEKVNASADAQTKKATLSYNPDLHGFNKFTVSQNIRNHDDSLSRGNLIFFAEQFNCSGNCCFR